MKPKTKTKSNLYKAFIMFRLKDGTVIHGDGVVEALRSADSKDAHFVARFNKELPTQKKKK